MKNRIVGLFPMFNQQHDKRYLRDSKRLSRNRVVQGEKVGRFLEKVIADIKMLDEMEKLARRLS